MIYASYSMLKDYGECKKKAYYHLIKEPKPETASLISGRVIHDMIDQYEKGYDGDLLSNYHKTLAKELSKDGIEFYRYQTVPKFLEWMDKCFTNYVEISRQLPRILETEKRFSIPYYEDSSIAPDTNVVGIFDQIREGDVVCELKTGKRKPDDEFLRADLQATVYIWAYEILYDKVPLYYYIHLPSGNVYQLERSNFDHFHDMVNDFIQTYTEENWTKERDGRKCNWCWYNKPCLETSEVGRHLFKAVGTTKTRRNSESTSFLEY